MPPTPLTSATTWAKPSNIIVLSITFCTRKRLSFTPPPARTETIDGPSLEALSMSL